MFWGLAGALILVVLLVGGVILALRVRQAKEKPAFVYHHNCPRCKQRIGYRKNQMGHKAMCPHCLLVLVFPTEPTPKA